MYLKHLLKSSSTFPELLSFHLKCISWSCSPCSTVTWPFRLSAVTKLVAASRFILPALKETRALGPDWRIPPPLKRAPPTAIVN